MQFKILTLLLFVLNLTNPAMAQKYLSTENVEVSKEWNGNTFTSAKTFVENISESKSLQFFAEIVADEELQAVLEKEEMVTIFVIADSSFLEIPEKSRDSILGNKELTLSMVKYLSVPGRLDSNSLKMAVSKNDGKAYLATLSGEKIGVREVSGKLQLVDSENRTATIIESDFYHKKGFFHIVDGLVFPISAK